MRAWCLVVIAAASASASACFDPHPSPGGACAPGDRCPDGLRCDNGICVAGDASMMIDACPAMSCEASQLTDCAGIHACAYGCGESAPPHCLALVPSNGIDPALLAGAEANFAELVAAFDTDTGEIRGAIDVVRAAGTGVKDGIGFAVVDGMGVFTARDFAVPALSTWTATGRNTLVLFAAETITVDGALDVGGKDIAGGPGGGGGGVGAPPAQCAGSDGGWKMSISAGGGGGGGGGAGAGGSGAPTMADGSGATGGGVGGGACAAPSTMPLRGGNGGGAGGTEQMIIRGGPGGGAGGAVGLVAMIRITVAGRVTAPGEGGATDSGGSGGGGGGGGGAVFVESPAIEISGAITANGGGGGAPGNDLAGRVYGARGHGDDGIPAAGGIYNGKAGGAGGAAASPATAGETDHGGGGGGGAAGVIGIRGTMVGIADATLSPASTQTSAILQ